MSSYTVGFEDRNAHFQRSEMSTSALSSTLSLPVVFARQEPRKVPPHEDPDPRVVEALKPKRGVKVEGQGAKLLEFAGGSGWVEGCSQTLLFLWLVGWLGAAGWWVDATCRR